MLRGRGLGLGLCAAAALSLAAGGALAQESAPPQGNQAGPPTDGKISAPRPFWTSAASGPFLSSILEAGILYVRPQLAVGYGKPHWMWVGVEGNVSVSLNGGSEYAGIRAASPYIDFRAGARYVFPLNQYFIPAQDNVTRDETEYKLGDQSRYVALETELSGSAPVPGGSLFAIASVYRVFGVPEGFFVYDESLHVVVDPPWLVRARIGYLVAFGANQNLKLGPAAEWVGLLGRHASVYRAGPVLTIALTHHLDAVGSLMVVIESPDNLGLLGADLGLLGLRYRWASSDRWPEVP